MNKIFLIVVGIIFSFSVFAKNITVQTQFITDNSENPKYSITAKYPQITGKNLSNAEYRFNEIAKRWVTARIGSFKETFDKLDTSHLPPEILENGSYLNIDYDLMTIEPGDLMSLRYHTDYNRVGSAHPNQEYAAINYDLKNNKKLNITDLFKSYSNALQRISSYATQTLKPKLGNSLFKEGLTPTLKNYAVWNINKKGIRITFNNYQVAPYVYGPQEITIPYRLIENLVSDQSSLFPCVKSGQNCYFKLKQS